MKINKKTVSAVVVTMLILTFFVNISTNNFVFSPFVITSKADYNSCSNNNSAWHNSSYLNVTVEAKYPRILWYDVQKCTVDNGADNTNPPSYGANWHSIRNGIGETDNATWYRFVVNVSSDQGWDNIEFINITGWHDNGTLESGSDYNHSTAATSNRGANRNFWLQYRNTSGTAEYNLIYPANRTEFTKGYFTEHSVNDPLGISGSTETHNLTFVFKPGYQFRYAPGPGESSAWDNSTVTCVSGDVTGSDDYDCDMDSCWFESFNNTWSWNFNMTVENNGESWENDKYISWINDEFGMYSYTEIVNAGDASIHGAPTGEKYSTNSSSHFNQVTYGGDGNSHNVTVRTRCNGNYTMAVNVSDLEHVANSAIALDNKTIWIRGGTRTSSVNFSDAGQSVIYLYGTGAGNGSLGSISSWEEQEINGTCKYTGEVASDTGLSEQYPNPHIYNSSNYDGHNARSYTVEFGCVIPTGQQAGIYSDHVYYHLRTQIHQ